MSYREEKGEIVLRMPREDYEVILMALGAWTAQTWQKGGSERMFRLLNRLNEGNPHYRPYVLDGKAS